MSLIHVLYAVIQVTLLRVYWKCPFIFKRVAFVSWILLKGNRRWKFSENEGESTATDINSNSNSPWEATWTLVSITVLDFCFGRVARVCAIQEKRGWEIRRIKVHEAVCMLMKFCGHRFNNNQEISEILSYSICLSSCFIAAIAWDGLKMVKNAHARRSARSQTDLLPPPSYIPLCSCRSCVMN